MAGSCHQPASREIRVERHSDWQRNTIPARPNRPEFPEGDHAGPNRGRKKAARRPGLPQRRLAQKGLPSAGLEEATAGRRRRSSRTGRRRLIDSGGSGRAALSYSVSYLLQAQRSQQDSKPSSWISANSHSNDSSTG